MMRSEAQAHTVKPAALYEALMALRGRVVVVYERKAFSM